MRFEIVGNRRDVLLSVGAVIGVASLSLLRLNRRYYGIVPAEEAGVGTPVERMQEPYPRSCTAGTVTPQQTEGPFYTPKTPHRRDIRDYDVRMPPLIVVGRVFDSLCRPIAGAILDFWQTSHEGEYDQHGYRYRGHQYTDSFGRFELVTVRPHSYTAMSAFRTPHIHVKVQAPRSPLLTTQVYLPDAEETNARDYLYDPSLNIAFTQQDGAAQHAVFDFVLADA